MTSRQFAPREGFSIVMSGSQIKEHIECFAQYHEEAAKKLEEQIAELQTQSASPRSGPLPDGVTLRVLDPALSGPHLAHISYSPQRDIQYMESNRQAYLDAAQRHRKFASYIEVNENFRLSREDILFLSLLGYGKSSTMLPGVGC